jgi:hypothetical protein
MSQRESNTFARLKLLVTRPEDRFERVENPLVSGMPDVNYCLTGAEGWLEIKCPEIPVREETAVFRSSHPVSQEQSNWFLAQIRSGGRANLFIATKKILLLIPKHIAQNNHLVNNMPLRELKIHATWQADVPVRDAESWVNLRGKLRE